ncbi:hypothetical protein NDU88_007073 [Pleurodeles waltl]|uniref:Uncharacterized protein n=1 Tax=Pleurodeles waltl TaxID=8319 RepID=A0AAV7NTX4_PLEWA|nr:hypothetical protein NDU88_007073 [Pleurodeles waltl]
MVVTGVMADFGLPIRPPNIREGPTEGHTIRFKPTRPALAYQIHRSRIDGSSHVVRHPPAAVYAAEAAQAMCDLNHGPKGATELLCQYPRGSVRSVTVPAALQASPITGSSGPDPCHRACLSGGRQRPSGAPATHAADIVQPHRRLHSLPAPFTSSEALPQQCGTPACSESRITPGSLHGQQGTRDPPGSRRAPRCRIINWRERSCKLCCRSCRHLWCPSNMVKHE